MTQDELEKIFRNWIGRNIPERTPEQIEEDNKYVAPPRHGHDDGRVSVNELPSETPNIFDDENHGAW